jgi:hypothetical protein
MHSFLKHIWQKCTASFRILYQDAQFHILYSPNMLSEYLFEKKPQYEKLAKRTVSFGLFNIGAQYDYTCFAKANSFIPLFGEGA